MSRQSARPDIRTRIIASHAFLSARLIACAHAARRKENATRKAWQIFARRAKIIGHKSLRARWEIRGDFRISRRQEEKKIPSRKQEISRIVKQFNRRATREKKKRSRDAPRASKLIPFLCSRVIGSHRWNWCEQKQEDSEEVYAHAMEVHTRLLSRGKRAPSFARHVSLFLYHSQAFAVI